MMHSQLGNNVIFYVVITEKCDVVVISDELIGTTEYLTAREMSYKPMSL